jgi:hypothetical protein
MPLALYSDALDDVPEVETETGFFGVDETLKPTLLAPGMLHGGSNILLDVDGLVKTRPGLRYNALLNTTPLNVGTYAVQGIGYYDIPGFERTLAVRNGRMYEVSSDQVGAIVALITGVAPSATAPVKFEQLVDRAFWVDGTVLGWVQRSGGVWNTGTVDLLSTGDAMPAFTLLCAHAFRLFGVVDESDEIYPSNELSAHVSGVAGDWDPIKTVRVGKGGGDPIKALLSGQDNNLISLNQGSCWQIDTTDASPANWPIRKITDKAGCVAGGTAVQFGQDIMFLSRYGVVSLGALERTDSISPATTLSAPIQSTMDRINWSAVSTAFAVVWKNFYLLAVALDNSPVPNVILPYNVSTQKWMGSWTGNLFGIEIATGPSVFANFTGFTAGVNTTFAGKQEAIIGDSCGRLLRFDDTVQKDFDNASNGNDVVAWAYLRSLVFGMQENSKQPFWLETEFYKSTSTNLTVAIVRDDAPTYPEVAIGACEVVASGLRGSNFPTFPFVLPLTLVTRFTSRFPKHIRNFQPFRELAVQIISYNGTMNLRQIKAAAFIDTVRIHE